LPPSSKEAVVLRVHTHEASSIESAVVVIEFELVLIISANSINLPSNSLKDGVYRVMLESPAEDLLGEPDEQIPDFRVFRMKCFNLRAHLIQPS
jgi:hypothetical protein